MEFRDIPSISVAPYKKYGFQATVLERDVQMHASLEIRDVRYRRALRALVVFEAIGAGLIGIAALVYGVYQLQSPDTTISFSGRETIWGSATLLMSIGLLAVTFLWYRVLAAKEPQQFITDIHNQKKPIALWQYVTPQTKGVIEAAVHYASEWGNEQVLTSHMFAALLDNTRTQNMFIRLGVPAASVRDMLEQLARKQGNNRRTTPTLSTDVQAAILYTYELAVEADQPVVDVTELVLATIVYDPKIQEILYDLEVEYQKIENMLLWLRTQAELRRRRARQAAGAAHMSKHGMDRAMTAVATPFLNAYSHDITIDVKYGHVEPCVAREKEIQEIIEIIESGRQNILLVGERGVGKRAIIYGIASRIVAGTVPNVMLEKRLVELSVSSLVAGTTVSGAQERLIRIINEVRKSGNIMLFIDNLDDLVNPGDAGVDISETLAELTSDSNFVTFATTTPQGFTQQIAHSAIGSTIADVQVDIMDDNQAIQVLESKAPYIEYRQRVFFSYQAIASAVTLAKKFMQQQVIPESAIGLLSEAASHARTERDDNTLVTEADVANVVSNKTGVPVTAVSEDESSKLLSLEEAMHERVVGQFEAVQLVANALRRARASVRSTNRPIANFLFLGPTGVGKTELAKTIADVYFGGEDRMIRLDMSEYQDSSAVYRLIGQAGQQGSGLLTEAVRQQPFSLLLLDEMEKADPNVLNIFLQVFDDGRLTDSVGRVVDFSNTIIIATSNAGTSYVQQQLQAGVSYEQIQQALMHGELQQYYRPEFLNRFDGVVLFQSLKQDDIIKIAGLMLKRTAADLETRGISLDITDGALAALAKVGFDPEFGARPMRRAIQDTIENQLAELLLSNSVNRRDTVQVQPDLTLKVVSS